MPQRWLVLLNAQAGTIQRCGDDDLPARLEQALRAGGIEPEVRSAAPSEIASLARGAVPRGYDAVIAGGGDGTINAIAAELLGSPIAFGVLPLGTFNHFAKDLGLPADIDEAAIALARGQPQHFPIGEVNGRIFLNFSGIGLHPRMVSQRERAREPGKSKVLATFIAAVRSLLRLPVLSVRLVLPGQTLRRLTPSLIICNNQHQMRAFGVEAQSATDRRLLNVYVAHARRPLGMLWLLVRAMLRLLGTSNLFEVIAAPQVTVKLRRRSVTVSIDGELVRMRTPLRYNVRENALRVIVPAEGQGSNAAAATVPQNLHPRR
jgi:diacylglycerol kinase family enzyme